MGRPLAEIAADLEAIETTMKNSTHSVVEATMTIAGTAMPEGVPDIRTVPALFVLPDGRKLELAQIAAELREWTPTE